MQFKLAKRVDIKYSHRKEIEMNKGKKNIQQILSFLLLAFTLCAVLWIGLKDNDLQDLAAALEKLSFGHILLLVVCWAAYVFFDALAIHHFLRVLCRLKQLRELLVKSAVRRHLPQGVFQQALVGGIHIKKLLEHIHGLYLILGKAGHYAGNIEHGDPQCLIEHAKMLRRFRAQQLDEVFEQIQSRLKFHRKRPFLLIF